MRRLVYAPKAFVFVRSSNLDGRIFDLSSDVVSGSVDRNVGDLSTAEVVFRNRFKKWLRDPVTKKSIFLPNDLITIFLQRIAGKPIQVFTGYLDSTPYYQAYPDNCRLTASCTLKRLAYTWFDPGLNFFTTWLQNQEGWSYDPVNTQALVKALPSAASGNNFIATDANYAQLLHDFMRDIAGWEEADIIVADLPPHLPKVAANLFAKITAATNTDMRTLEQALTEIMGLSIPLINPGDPPITQGQAKIVNTIKQNAGSIPPLLLVFAAVLLTNLNAGYRQTIETEDSWGYGLYALRPTRITAPKGTGGFGPTDPAGLVATQIDGHPLNDMLNAAIATQVFVKRLIRAQGPWVQLAKRFDRDSMVTWISKAIGYTIPDAKLSDVDGLFTTAKQAAGAGFVASGTGQPIYQIDATHADFNDPKLQKMLSTQEKGLLNHSYGKTQTSAPWLASVLWKAKNISPELRLAAPRNIGPTALAINGPAAQIQKLYSAFLGDERVDTVTMNAGGKKTTLVKGVSSALGQSTIPSDSLVVSWPTKPTAQPTTGSKANGNDPTSGIEPGKLTMQQFAQVSANAAFAANFAFNSNGIESNILHGDKALLNDVSCFDSIKQFCAASMRTFMSLPDGRFLAFYPDYFGAIRGPYWYIHDIEIINMGIQLNDEALATHVYVVGDTINFNNAVDWFEEIATGGVATITQAGMLESFIEGYDIIADTLVPKSTKDKQVARELGRLPDAYAFLQHYGARPHKEEPAIIRTHFFEFLLAWQRFMQLWASQFATDVQFTFQPEIFAGGIIGFPEHELQVFVEKVTHTWDYSSGFETSAVISSPSHMRPKKGKTYADQYPGFALAGGTNTVGLSA